MANIKVMIDGEFPDEELHRLLKMAGMPVPGAACPPPASDAMVHPIQGNMSPAEVARNTINGITPVNHLGTYTESEESDEDADDKEDDELDEGFSQERHNQDKEHVKRKIDADQRNREKNALDAWIKNAPKSKESENEDINEDSLADHKREQARKLAQAKLAKDRKEAANKNVVDHIKATKESKEKEVDEGEDYEYIKQRNEQTRKNQADKMKKERDAKREIDIKKGLDSLHGKKAVDEGEDYEYIKQRNEKNRKEQADKIKKQEAAKREAAANKAAEQLSKKKAVDEQADYDYGRNPTSRKGHVSGFNPYDYEGTADEPVRSVPARSGDNPLKGLKPATPQIREDKKLGQYLKEVECKKGKPFKKFVSKKEQDAKDKKKK
jgi:hypothetical protein